MTKKSCRLLLLSLTAFLACALFFPAGNKNDWPCWLYFLAFVVFFASLCYVWWAHPELAFKGVPIDKMKGKDKGLFFASFFVLTFSFEFILGMFGSGWWLVIIGLVMLFAFSFFQRYLINKYQK